MSLRQVKTIIKGAVNLHSVEKTAPSKKHRRDITLSPDPAKAATQIRKKFASAIWQNQTANRYI